MSASFVYNKLQFLQISNSATIYIQKISCYRSNCQFQTQKIPALHFYSARQYSAYYWKDRKTYSNNMSMKLLSYCDTVVSAYLFTLFVTSAIAKCARLYNTSYSMAYILFPNSYSVFLLPRIFISSKFVSLYEVFPFLPISLVFVCLKHCGRKKDDEQQQMITISFYVP